jgi:hypothetical protein
VPYFGVPTDLVWVMTIELVAIEKPGSSQVLVFSIREHQALESASELEDPGLPSK